MTNLKGILPAVVTPIDDRGSFQAAAFEQLVERLYAAGVDGLYVCGQTGEGLRLAMSERKAVAEAAVRCSPSGKQVIVHVGAPTTAEAMELARHATAAGAHAISSLPPLGSYSFAEVRQYFNDVAAASGVPLLIYYFPSIWGGSSKLEQILDLCSIPGVAGLKFTDSDLFQLHAIKRRGHAVFNGRDEMLAAGLLMGADGGIGSTYNLIPEEYVELRDCAARGDWEQARVVQARVNEFIEALLSYPFPAVIKALLEVSGIDCGHCIAPQRRLTAGELASLYASVARTELGSKFPVPVS